jgi:putative transposase
MYASGKKFITAYSFSKWLNNEYIPQNPDKKWIKGVSSKAVKKSIVNAEMAYKRFFDKLGGFPKFKKKRNQDIKMYFVKTDAKTLIKCARHKIQIPTLGFVRLKEYGYLPADKIIKSGTVSEKAGRFYVTVLTGEEAPKEKALLNERGLGVDLGIKELAVSSSGQVFGNKNKTDKMKKLEKKLKREQRSLSRKYKNKKKRGEKLLAKSANIEKNVLRVQKLHQAISRKRQEYIRYVISILVKTKPKYITIEDLNISGMMKNRHLSKAIAGQNFYYFRSWLIYKCACFGIEVRIAGRYYPSSKLCSVCGQLKRDLKLSDRTYNCGCGNSIDRDLQAGINLERCKKYKTA